MAMVGAVGRRATGDWGAPKSEASNATIPVNREVVSRIFQLRNVTVVIRAGPATRRYPALKGTGPDDLVFASVVKGAPMRDNNVLVRHLKPAARKLGMEWVNWQVLRRSHAMGCIRERAVVSSRVGTILREGGRARQAGKDQQNGTNHQERLRPPRKIKQ